MQFTQNGNSTVMQGLMRPHIKQIMDGNDAMRNGTIQPGKEIRSLYKNVSNWTA